MTGVDPVGFRDEIDLASSFIDARYLTMAPTPAGARNTRRLQIRTLCIPARISLRGHVGLLAQGFGCDGTVSFSLSLIV